jgi:hypothetical protein
MAFHSTSSAQWRPLDSRFAQLEGRLTQHRRWLEKETESQVQDFAIVEQHRQRYLRSLHRHVSANVDQGGELHEYRVAKRIKRVEIVCDWLSNGSKTQHATANATHSDHLGSCNWFLDLKKYLDWKKKSFDRSFANDKSILQGNWHDRVLFVP